MIFGYELAYNIHNISINIKLNLCVTLQRHHVCALAACVGYNVKKRYHLNLVATGIYK